MSFTQLTSPLPVFVIGKGKGTAMAVIDYGPEHNLIWVTAIDDSGEIWCAPNSLVRMQANWTSGRGRSQAEEMSRDCVQAYPAATGGPSMHVMKGSVPV